MKSPTSEVKCGERVFQMQSNIYAVNFTNNISRSGWTWQKLWNLLITNFKNKSFHNSVDWSGLYLGKCISLHNWKTIWDSRFLNDWKMHLWNSPSLGMIWLLIPYVEQLSLPLHKLSPLKNLKKEKKNVSHLPCKAFRKRSFHALSERHYALGSLGNYWGVCAPYTFWRKWTKTC